MSTKTVFAANDLYNKTFLAFMVTIGVLFALILLLACLYRLQKKAHNSVMQTKKELKRINLQKMYKDMHDGSEVKNSRKGSMFQEEVKEHIDDDFE